MKARSVIHTLYWSFLGWWLVSISFAIATGIGWLLNLVHFIVWASSPAGSVTTKHTVMLIAALFPPLGILGYWT
jgi:predicted Abi (CAAX) family protease